MELIFENTRGRLIFRGKRNSHKTDAALYIKKITGLGFPQREEHVRQFAGERGQLFLSGRELARTITVSADICRAEGIRTELENVMEILFLPGNLTVHAGNLHRCIACRCISIDEGERYGESIMSVVLQFVCDDPFFTGAERQEELLLSRRDLVSGKVMFPCVFTEKVNQKTVVNRGNVRTEPVFDLYYTGEKAPEVAEGKTDCITILNHETGQKIVLLYTLSPGEKVTLNIPDRQIYSELAGDITASLSPDSYLSDFWLEPGHNLLEGNSESGWASTHIMLAYHHRYFEAVI